jgi:hypothetical protein
MAGRNHAGKMKATQSLSDRTRGVGDSKQAIVDRLGLTPAEKDRLDRALAEILASAGVPSSRIALEVLFLLPDRFVDVYAQVFEAGLIAPVKAPGEAAGLAGELGRAPGSTSALRGTVSQVSGTGKKYKRIWVIKSEGALELKNRIDKRLRAMGREMELELEEIRKLELGGEGKASSGKGKVASSQAGCGRCGRLVRDDYRFCPSCGQDLNARD